MSALALGFLVNCGGNTSSSATDGNGNGGAQAVDGGKQVIEVGDARQVGACDRSDALVSGRIVRDLTSGYQYLADMVLGDDSVAIVSLYSNPALGGDAPDTLVAEQRLSPAPALPFDFCITGTLADPHLSHWVSAQVWQHEGKKTAGDLMSEVLYTVKPPVKGAELPVVGLESCSDPGAGGFCQAP